MRVSFFVFDAVVIVLPLSVFGQRAFVSLLAVGFFAAWLFQRFFGPRRVPMLQRPDRCGLDSSCVETVRACV